jgi:uncharacterized protein
MTSQANIDLVQRLYAAFLCGDIETVVAATTPTVTWEVTGRPQDHPLLGLRTGPRGVQEFFETLGYVQDAVEFTPREFHAAVDKVFVLGRYSWTIRKSGRTVASNWIHVFTIRDRRIAAFVEFTDTAKFAEAYRGNGALSPEHAPGDVS